MRLQKHGFLRSAKIASGPLTSFCQERRLAVEKMTGKSFVGFWSFLWSSIITFLTILKFIVKWDIWDLGEICINAE